MERFSLDQITAGLIIDGFDPLRKLYWLEKSYEMSEGFFTVLLSVYGKTHGYYAKTVPYKQYDFYYDIFKKDNLDKVAYIYYDFNDSRHELTYHDIQQMVDGTAEAWMLRGAVRGNVICIVRPLSVAFVVSVLSALKLGLVLSFLSPSRPYLIQRQLQALNPDYISTGKAYYAIVREFRTKIIETMAPCPGAVSRDELKRSCAFMSGEIAARLFDYTSDNLFEPVDITCDELYLYPLRDGLIALDLRPGDIFAAPGFSFCDTQPAMMLSSLLTGATFLDIKPENYRRSPALLLRDGVTIFGVTSDLRDVIQESQINALESCRFWFRTPSPSTAYHQWQVFIRKTGIGHVLTGVLKWSSQAGGLLFFSGKRKGVAIDKVLPSAGLPWSLVPAMENDDTPCDDFGFLSISCPNGDKITPCLVMRDAYEWLLLSFRFIEKGGKRYPMDVVSQFIQTTGICRYFFMMERAYPVGPSPRIHLIVFTGLETTVDCAGIKDKLNKKISLAMGWEYCPDVIDFFPMLPRLNVDGSIDVAWCQAQYADNRLTLKSGNTVFMGLALIKELIFKKMWGGLQHRPLE